MSFDYNKIQSKKEESNQWASYSDLFMVLSIVFLLLYVVASVRNGTFSMQKQLQLKEMKEQTADLKNQIQAYNALKDGYLKQEATKNEQQLYKDLMGKLDLLKEEQNREKNELIKQAKENEKKEVALNQYQQVIRNIINANLISKSRIKRRDVIITKKQNIISKKKNEITKLEKTVASKEKVINSNQKKISSLDKNLKKQISRLKVSRKKLKLTRKQLSRKITSLKKQTKLKIQNLKKKNNLITSQLKSEKSKIENQIKKVKELNKQVLAEAKQKLDKTKSELAKASRQNREYKQEMESLEETFKNELKQKQQAFNAELKVQQLSALEKSKRITEFQKELAQEKLKHLSQVGDLNKLIKETSQSLSKTKNQNRKFAASITNLKKDKKSLTKDLKKAKSILAAKKKIATAIQNNFKKAGIKAEIDEKSGDVTLSFGRDYFDPGRAHLKSNMRKTLNKFVPIYAKSLFKDTKIAEKIESVEIVGFASPTYGGKYISPTSLRPEDKEAIKYNLDLSIERAKSIFDHMFDTDKLKYNHQHKLRQKVKVTGRGFFSQKDNPTDLKSGVSRKIFCEKYDCQKARKVIVKFNLED